MSGETVLSQRVLEALGIGLRGISGLVSISVEVHVVLGYQVCRPAYGIDSMFAFEVMESSYLGC